MRRIGVAAALAAILAIGCTRVTRYRAQLLENERAEEVRLCNAMCRRHSSDQRAFLDCFAKCPDVVIENETCELTDQPPWALCEQDKRFDTAKTVLALTGTAAAGFVVYFAVFAYLMRNTH